ncbi:hypothetical protein BX661DRAFT_176309 [Kickxella alabastrina]|uniref:uncharacterized protein n=1 Tax=Kickxella alabastrina TaxID=61397 RepID=UPI00221EC713|nr:uncharacterized protein BX661DRAFT_176309 [Kickxella alabastrina]KAI7835212.1 hypothetical protein BX661DRAFT_176309 [Kickxella alabastrina]KAJ1947013.1 hypothetical protein GGF37_000745 [Kickxella alabastrina]
MPAIIKLVSSFFLFATICSAGCENPALFKKCLAQTRAEVNICGINMTCKCIRQGYVAQCYDKCGDDEHFMKLKAGEKGYQQIICSQKRPGEPEDMPIIGSEGPTTEPKKNSVPQPPQANKKLQSPPPPPAAGPEGPDRRGDRGASDDDGVIVKGGVRGSRNSGGAVLVKDADIDGASGLQGMSVVGSIAAALAVAVLAVGSSHAL